jgi:hypothetical protein
MDIFGALQMCSIAVVSGPITVRISRTYFYDKRRNIIFAWTLLILSGKSSLARCKIRTLRVVLGGVILGYLSTWAPNLGSSQCLGGNLKLCTAVS